MGSVPGRASPVSGALERIHGGRTGRTADDVGAIGPPLTVAATAELGPTTSGLVPTNRAMHTPSRDIPGEGDDPSDGTGTKDDQADSDRHDQGQATALAPSEPHQGRDGDNRGNRRRREQSAEPAERPHLRIASAFIQWQHHL